MKNTETGYYHDFIKSGKVVFYNQMILPYCGKTYLDYELDPIASKSIHREQHLRRFCMDYTPETDALSDHDFEGIIRGAYGLDIDSICQLNTMLPAVIYDMPTVKKHIQDLTMIAMRSTDSGKAYDARTALKRIACPKKVDRDSMPITQHALKAVHFVFMDVALIKALHADHKHIAESRSLQNAIHRQFADIPARWIKSACESNRLFDVAAARAGELIGYKSGRGLAAHWRREKDGDERQIKADAKRAAALVNLF